MLHLFQKLVMTAMLVLASVTPVFAQYSNLPAMGDTARDELSPLMEYRIGTEIMRRIQVDPDYVADGVIIEYLNTLGNRLVSATPAVRGEAVNDFFFFAIRDSSLNAFALPGGFIGVHTGLMIAAQSESELASVLAHEIGHVSQRHIARMVSQRKQDLLIPIAAIVLAAIAGASRNADLAGALITGGHGLAIQKQLNFSRDAEREADRVGFQILQAAGFDTNAAASFFERLQLASRNYGESISVYLRTHPLTTERIADMQTRARSEPYRQHADSADFNFARIRARLLQDGSVKGLEAASVEFNDLIRTGGRFHVAAGYYGQALLALRQDNPARAAEYLQESRNRLGERMARNSLALASTAIDIKIVANKPQEASREALAALARFPTSRTLSYQFADALFKEGRYETASQYLRRQKQIYRNDQALRNMLAKVYDAQGKIALMHLELAESYSLAGGLSAALEQLALARQAPDVTFYDHSIIDAREREWRARRLEELKGR